MRVVLVAPSPNDAAAEKLRKLVLSLPGCRDFALASFDHAEEVCSRIQPHYVIVMIVPDQTDRGLNAIRRVRTAAPGNVLAIGPATDPKLILKAMQCGADLYLDQAEMATELEAALSRLRNNREVETPAGRVLAVFSASGGCGASTLAVNLAVSLAKAHGTCNLIDLNAGKGDLAPLLDIRPQYTLADLCRNEARLDRAMYEKLLSRHDCGVHLLAAPQQFSDIRALTTRGIGQALVLAAKMYPHVVVDLEDCFHEEQCHVLERASSVLLVCRMDFTSLRNTRRCLEHLSKIGVNRSRVKVVVNQFGQPNQVPVDEAEEAVGERLTRFVPYDPKTINRANNGGVPAALGEPATAAVQSIIQLGCQDAERVEKRSALSGLVPRLKMLF